ncbi:DUF6443 domain-containing protein [Aquimarina sp. 2304DJ70-9]|uniref:DUF6443 domain-containing protein n=1 Tax=Aquimarina penaris TaxID=3231044 RepID=UPI003461E50F
MKNIKQATISHTFTLGIALILFLVSIVSLSAQSMSGNSTVTTGSSHIYTFTPIPGTTPFGGNWQIDGDISYNLLSGNRVRVNWSNSPRSGLVKFSSPNSGTAQLAINIVAPEPPPPPPSVRNTTICGFGTITVEAYGAPSGSTYKWYRENNTFIKNGATYNVTFTNGINPILEKRYRVSYVKNGRESTKRLVVTRSFPIPQVVNAGSDLAMCLNTPRLSLSGIPDGGAWSGNGIINTSSGYRFNPNSAGSGAHTLTYRYTNEYGCSKSDTRKITVKSLPVDDAGPNIGLFSDSGLYDLSNDNTNPSVINKSWSGPGVIGNGPMFNPSDAGSSNAIVYNYSDSNCNNSDSRVIFVYQPPAILQDGDFILSDGHNVVDLTVHNVYPNYTWYKDNSPIPGANLRTYSVTSPGVYSVRIILEGGISRLTRPVQIFRNSDLINYVRAYTTQKEGFTSTQSVISAPVDDVRVNTNYLDAMGRNLQSVSKQNSQQKKDLVNHTIYDQFGRQYKKYLPYVSNYGSGSYKDIDIQNTSSSPQFQFYQNVNDKVANTSTPWADTKFEPSPLNRTIEQGAQGEDWQLGTDHTIRYLYRSNTASDDIALWKKGPEGLISNQPYSENSLTVNQIKDESGNTKITYIDKLGRKIMDEMEDGTTRWARTYYVYDSFGRITNVIPPLTSEALSNTYPKIITQEVLNRECYQYEFDYRGRNIVKKLPGADMMVMVYDRWDRLTFSQDGNQRTNNQWSFTKYDIFDRPVLSGITTINGDRNTVQEQVDNFFNAATFAPHIRFENLGSHSLSHGYTNMSYPRLNSNDKVLSVTYYDNYNFKTNPVWGGSAIISVFVPEIDVDDPLESPRGQITGTKINILGTDEYLYNVNFYDSKYRLVQTTSTNHLGGSDRYTTQFDFIGNVLEDFRTHIALDNQLTIHKEYTYDHQGLELRTYHTINNGDRILLSENKYNEIGQLIEKNLHSTNNGQNFLQSIDYRYNIRGWLKSINNPQLAINPENNDDDNDLFGMELLYNQSNTELGNTPSYNRNISAIKWRSAEQNEEQSYTYTYDPMNRLKTAHYRNITNPSKNGLYNVGGYVGIAGDTGINYDKNGNILHLLRKGLINNSVGVIDDLQYEYSGNQLISVNDLGDASIGFKVIGNSNDGGSLPPDPNEGPPIIPGGGNDH